MSSSVLSFIRDASYDLQLFGRFDVGAGILDDYPGTTGDGFHGGPSIDILSRGAAIRGATKEEPFGATTENASAPYTGDEKTKERVIDFLKKHAPSVGKPTFMWVGILDPHPPYDTNQQYLDHLNASNVDAPELPPRASMHPYDVDMSVLKNAYNIDYTPAQLIKMRSAYWGACAQALNIFSEILSTAETTGHLDNTVVIYTSDHGEMSMEHRMDYKNSLREPSARVPLIITPYNVPAFSGVAGTVVLNVTSHVDILPTILELAGATVPANARGQSLVPFLVPAHRRSAAQLLQLATRPDSAVLQYHSNLGSTGSFGLRGPRYKLITFGHSYPWFATTNYTSMLFDESTDPLEMTDVAAQNPDIVAAMFATLETALGGPGSVAAIDLLQMQRNKQLFKDFIVKDLSFAELLAKFMTTYTNVTESEVSDKLQRWINASP